MSRKGYWSFNERHPRHRDERRLYCRMIRFIDQLDDAFTALASEMEFLRMRMAGTV